MRKFILLFALLFSIASIAQSNSSLAQRRAAHLRHGINFSEWFAQVYDPKGYTKEHLETWVTTDGVAAGPDPSPGARRSPQAAR